MIREEWDKIKAPGKRLTKKARDSVEQSLAEKLLQTIEKQKREKSGSF